MPKKAKPSPTELSILKALWTDAPLSAREVHEKVNPILDWSFSSTRKTLDRMCEKKYLKTEDAHGVKVYVSQISKIKTLASYVKDFADRVLEVDGPLPVSMFADSKLLDDNELAELEKLLQNDSDGVA